jgi:hypothetical protein
METAFSHSLGQKGSFVCYIRVAQFLVKPVNERTRKYAYTLLAFIGVSHLRRHEDNKNDKLFLRVHERIFEISLSILVVGIFQHAEDDDD